MRNATYHYYSAADLIKLGDKLAYQIVRRNKIDGKNVTFTRAGVYEKNPFLKRMAEDFCKYCNKTSLFNNKISLKYLPGATKGLGFVTASILGYKAGIAAGNTLLGKPTVGNPLNDATAP